MIYSNIPISTKLLFLFSLVLFSCNEETTRTVYYDITEPVYISESQYFNEFVNLPAREVQTSGKIFIKDQYLLMAEANIGVHIMDNTDPSNPLKINFIEVPKIRDLVVRDEFLYVDSGIDLLVFDISDPSNVIGVKRLAQAFLPEYNGPDKGIYIKDSIVGQGSYEVCISDCYETTTIDSNTLDTSELGGSTSRFTAIGDHLYVVTHRDLITFDINERSAPEFMQSTSVGWGIETIFPADNNLFIGSNAGMYIYGLDDVSNPNFLSVVEHVRSYDPVIAKDGFAYVTLRAGNTCYKNNQNSRASEVATTPVPDILFGTNQLDVIDIADLRSPVLRTSLSMGNPFGLTMDENCLFITENNCGLTVLDLKKLHALNEDQQRGLELDLSGLPDSINPVITVIDSIHATDAIADKGILSVVGNEGVYQYQYDCSQQGAEVVKEAGK